MKNLVYFILLVLLTTSSCKKKEACDGVICQNGGSCVDGVCACDSTWTGTNCETPICGLHQHVETNSCVCDSGWVGIDCKVEVIPIDSFVGSYHVTGTRQSANGISYIDRIITVTKVDSVTLSVTGNELLHQSLNTTVYLFEVKYASFLYQSITFRKPFMDDSLFYYMRTSSPGAATYESYRGVKIH